MADKVGKTDLMIQASKTVAENIRLERLQQILQNDESLTGGQKRKLIKQYFRNLFEARKQQYEEALEVDKHRLRAMKEASMKRIDVEKDTIIFQIRGEYVDTLRQMGAEIEERQLNFMMEFGERITGLQRKLSKRDIAPAYKKKIEEMIDSAFDRFAEKLVALAEDLTENATAKNNLD